MLYIDKNGKLFQYNTLEYGKKAIEYTIKEAVSLTRYLLELDNRKGYANKNKDYQKEASILKNLIAYDNTLPHPYPEKHNTVMEIDDWTYNLCYRVSMDKNDKRLYTDTNVYKSLYIDGNSAATTAAEKFAKESKQGNPAIELVMQHNILAERYAHIKMFDSNDGINPIFQTDIPEWAPKELCIEAFEMLNTELEKAGYNIQSTSDTVMKKLKELTQKYTAGKTDAVSITVAGKKSIESIL